MSEIVRANLLNSTGRYDSVEPSAVFYDHSDLPDGQRMAAWFPIDLCRIQHNYDLPLSMLS